MVRYIIGPLVMAVLGYFAAVGESGNNGWLQLVGLIAISGVAGATLPMIAFGFRHITRLYGVAFIVGVLVFVIVARIQG